MSANGTTIKSDIVEFAPNRPERIAVKFAQPRLIQVRGEERAMFTLTDGRVMFHDPEDARQIKMLGVQPGQFFYMMLRWSGKRSDPKIYQVWLEPTEAEDPGPYGRQPNGTYHVPSVPPPPAPAPAAPTNGRPLPANELERQLRDSLEVAELRKRLAAAEAAAAAPASSPRPPALENPWAAQVIERTQRTLTIYWDVVEWAREAFPGITKNEIRCFVMNSLISAERNGGLK
ncbi:MAG: hypothetical protein KGL39_41225 [Patescibacteria group bacterium]|nr:hypothetical protein [Patescibacteria group bacterium]